MGVLLQCVSKETLCPYVDDACLVPAAFAVFEAVTESEDVVVCFGTMVRRCYATSERPLGIKVPNVLSGQGDILGDSDLWRGTVLESLRYNLGDIVVTLLALIGYSLSEQCRGVLDSQGSHVER